MDHFIFSYTGTRLLTSVERHYYCVDRLSYCYLVSFVSCINLYRIC